jgi:phosphoglycerate dehydrogenase-like enzyme
LHAALTPQNRGLLGEAQLRKMKPNSYLINTARGALVMKTRCFVP